MLFRKNTPEKEPEGEDKELNPVSDLDPVAEDTLDSVNGAGNPFEGLPSVPQQPIDEELRKRV